MDLKDIFGTITYDEYFGWGDSCLDDINMHERLIFDHKPASIIIKKIIKYYEKLCETMFPLLDENNERYEKYFSYNVIVETGGERISLMENPEVYYDLIKERLIEAESFKLEIHYDGDFPRYKMKEGDEDKYYCDCFGMYRILKDYEKIEDFEYIMLYMDWDYGEEIFFKFKNGCKCDVFEDAAEDVVDIEGDWWALNDSLGLEFDAEKYPEIVEKLHEVVRKYIRKAELYEKEKGIEAKQELNFGIDAMEEFWETSPLDLLVGYWIPYDLVEIRDFFEEINCAIEPIMDEVKCDVEFMLREGKKFAVAKCVWTEEGLKVVGCEL